MNRDNNIPLQCLHSIIVLKSTSEYHDMYRMMARFLDEGNIVVYAIGSEGMDLPKSRFVNHVYSKIRESGMIDDLEHHINVGALKIVDVREIYSANQDMRPDKLLQKWTGMLMKARRGGEFTGIVVISGGVRAFDQKQDRLVTYEQTILKAITELGSTRAICCYLPESLSELEFSSLISVTTAHQCVMDGNTVAFREITSFGLLDAINFGIEEILGPGSAKLIVQTMRMIYRMDEDAILSNPKAFEEKLRKVLGNSSDSVLKSISKKIRESL